MSTSNIKHTKRIISNDEATLYDIGDGITYFCLHTKLNIIEDGTMEILNAALDEVETNFSGMVIGTDADHFSVGLNLILLLERAKNKDWQAISQTLRNLQNVCTRLSQATKPVVAATIGMALGGGCELTFAADTVCALSSSQLGLVETRVGLIPGGGGTTEMASRCLLGQETSAPVDQLFSYVHSTYQTIRQAKVSKDATEAVKCGYLQQSDHISIQRDNLMNDAKQLTLSLWKNGYEPSKQQEVFVLGEEGIYRIKQQLEKMRESNDIDEYELLLGEKLAYVFCGGMLPTPQFVSRQYLLDLEHEIFLSLCSEPQTHARIESTLKKR